MKSFFIVLILCFCIHQSLLVAQEGGESDGMIEVFLIDAYVTAEPPHKFVLSFFTSDICLAKVIIDEKYEYDVSLKLNEDHKAEIDVTSFKIDSTYVSFVIHVTGEDGSKSKSEEFELFLSFNNKIVVEGDYGFLQVCCFGGVVFGLPSPTYVFSDGESYFGLAKEIPVLSFHSSGFRYPAGFISIEYAHIFEADYKNLLKIGYKHIFEMPIIEFVSPGISLFSNLKGINGLSAGLSLGLFNLRNFTIYAKYRYNFQPGGKQFQFHEISIGLYSNFFSFNL